MSPNDTLLGASPEGDTDTGADDATVSLDNLPSDEADLIEEIDSDQTIEDIVPEHSDQDLEKEEDDDDDQSD